MKNEIYEMGPHGLVRVDVPSNSVKNNLTPGTVLHWGGNMGFPSQDFAVIKRLQFERRGGEVYYDCLGLTTFEAHRVEGMHIKAETDPSVWHGQHFFLTPRVISGDEVLELIEPFNKKGVAVTEATRFAQDLEWDSLTVLDFVANIEDEFDVLISMNMQAEIETVGRLVDALQRLTAARGS